MPDNLSDNPQKESAKEPDEMRRLADLATGFALGELSEPELEELYRMLQGHGVSGSQAAQVVWQILGASMDLRSTLSDHFAVTVAHRVREADDPSFLRSFALRFGLGGAALPEALPDGGRKRRSGWRWLVPFLLLLALAGSTAVVWALSVRAQGPVVRELRGLATSGSVGLSTMQPLIPDKPVHLASGSALTLEWPGGVSVRIAGPATFLTHREGVTLLEGRSWLGCPGAFALTLPDGQVTTDGPADFAAEVEGGRSLLGVQSGTIAVQGMRSGGYVLRPAQAGAPDGEPFAWLTSLMLPELMAGRDVRILPVVFPSGTGGWRLRARIIWDGGEGEAVFRHAPQLPGQPAGFLRIVPGKVLRPSQAGQDEAFSLPGAPLSAREFEAGLRPGGRTYLKINGLEAPLDFPAGSSLWQIETSAGARVEVLNAHNGPEPRTQP